ncbi:hypothetical protein DGI_0078 [Megalodesulfovibrio gigas DSM 1382 = ATCC 19364]|uniref:Uncharacterized protein n=1 Tax=Megalodesulfovibrio gigas (strain ATCC 19364 / DSM 1382 / NCIMB 9332 / VKM B-1759) TaxID=1121448 RepID=T2G7A1_MEGG1|nr:hypothetical protein DGI_0078 [Megalodesulfovibrio gigas DSM 1382 = ATCC 19364]
MPSPKTLASLHLHHSATSQRSNRLHAKVTFQTLLLHSVLQCQKSECTAHQPWRPASP